MNEEIEKLFEELKSFHMDQYELNFWREVFPGLPNEEKSELMKNLRAQAEILKKINQPKGNSEEVSNSNEE